MWLRWLHAQDGDYKSGNDGYRDKMKTTAVAKRLHGTIRFSIDDNVNILSPNSKTIHTKFTKPASF